MSMIDTNSARALAFAHAAETMLRTLGGVEVAVRFASPTSASNSEFGLPSSTTSDVLISPVLVCNANANSTATNAPHLRASLASRNTAATKQFLLPAAAVENVASANGYASPSDWLASALGFFFDGTLYPIANIAAESFAGQPYLYRVTTG
jgi:hypothetical protein